MKSTVCLLGLLAGATVYVMWDHAFEVKGYMWVGIWYVMFTIDQIYIKRICDVVKMDSNWGRVFYTNLLSSLPLVFLSAYDHEVIILLKNVLHTVDRLRRISSKR